MAHHPDDLDELDAEFGYDDDIYDGYDDPFDAVDLPETVVDAVDCGLDRTLHHDEHYFDYGGGSYGRCEPEWMNPPARVRRRGALRRWAARDDKRGTFTGKHTYVPNPVLPPEWDMTPDEYRRASQRDNDEHFDYFDALVLASAGIGGSATWSSMALEPTSTLGTVADVALPLALAAGSLGSMFTGIRAVDYLRWRRHDFTVLAERDPAQVISITDLPPEVVEVLLLILDMGDSTAPPVSTVQRAVRLHLGYQCAATFAAAFEEQGTQPIAISPLAFLYQHCRAEMVALAEYASTVSDPWTTQAASRLTLQLGILDRTAKQRTKAAAEKREFHKRSEQTKSTGYNRVSGPSASHKVGQPDCTCHTCMTSLPINSTAQFTADALAARTPAGSRPSALTAQQRWDAALATHERVAKAWTEIVTDPLAALDHTLLLDVTQPRTAAFIEAYGHAQDLSAIHGHVMPTEEAEQRAYATAVRKADETWTEAVRHAKHVHLNWLPAEEEKRTRQAKGLLSTAADDTVPLHLRAEAAQKAADLLAKVASFVLPPAATQALEASLRALPAPSPVLGSSSSAILLAPDLEVETA